MREEETRRGEETGIIKKGRINNDTYEAHTWNKTETDRHRQTDRQNTKVPRPKVVPSLSSPMASSRCACLGTGGISNLLELLFRGLLVQFVPIEWAG